MRVEVIGKDLPYVGKRGTQHEVLDALGRVLITVGRVKEVVEPKPEPKVVPVDQPEETHEPKKPRRKRYSRRDLRAEQSDESDEAT